MTPFQTVAKELLNAFHITMRGDEEITALCAINSPQWMRDMIYACHKSLGERLPDDWIYESARVLTHAIVDSEYPDEESASDHWSDIASNGLDVYTHDLLRWLSRHLLNLDCCDEAQAEGTVANDASMFDRITAGQMYALEQIAFHLIKAIATEADARCIVCGQTEAGNTCCP